MSEIKYPNIRLRSKNELSKRLKHKRFSQKEALFLINDCITNKDKYWNDNENASEIKKEKHVRDASTTNLGRLLKMLDARLLKPYDELLPHYIFGGVSKKNHVKAVKNLLGVRRKRTFITIDLKQFFEQIPQERVQMFFMLKAQCSKNVAKIISELCCVPYGKKGSTGNAVLARGFATSPRLSIWTNINLFNKVYEIVQKELKGKDPRISIFIDDICISASKVTDEELLAVRDKINYAFINFDDNHSLILHPKNTKKGCNIMHHDENPEVLGLRLFRNKLAPGTKAYAKRCRLRDKKKICTKAEFPILKKQYVGTQRYKKYVETVKNISK